MTQHSLLFKSSLQQGDLYWRQQLRPRAGMIEGTDCKEKTGASASHADQLLVYKSASLRVHVRVLLFLMGTTSGFTSLQSGPSYWVHRMYPTHNKASLLSDDPIVEETKKCDESTNAALLESVTLQVINGRLDRSAMDEAVEKFNTHGVVVLRDIVPQSISELSAASLSANFDAYSSRLTELQVDIRGQSFGFAEIAHRSALR